MYKPFFLLFILIFMVHCHRKSIPETPTQESIPAGISKDTFTDPIDSSLVGYINMDSVLIDSTTTDTVLYFKQSGCFGKCPVFDLIVWENGSVVYHGRRYVQPSGKYVLQLSSEELGEIGGWVNKFQLNTLNPSYPSHMEEWIPDLPSSTTIWKSDNQKGSIYHNHSAPQNYLDFERHLRGWIQNQAWDSVPE